MTKHDVLDFLAHARQADAHEVAHALGVPFSTGAMALLRLTRQGLVSRFIDTEAGTYWYELSGRGLKRLTYFRSRE